MSTQSRASEILNKLAELGVLATMASLVALFVILEWRKRPLWAAAGILGGLICGMIIWAFGLPIGWQWLGASLGALSTPAAVLWINGKTPPELLREALDAWDKVKGRK